MKYESYGLGAVFNDRICKYVSFTGSMSFTRSFIMLYNIYCSNRKSCKYSEYFNFMQSNQYQYTEDLNSDKPGLLHNFIMKKARGTIFHLAKSRSYSYTEDSNLHHSLRSTFLTLP